MDARQYLERNRRLRQINAEYNRYWILLGLGVTIGTLIGFALFG